MTDQQLRERALTVPSEWPAEAWFDTVVLGELGIGAADAQHIAAWSPARALAALEVIAAHRRCAERFGFKAETLEVWDALGGDA